MSDPREKKQVPTTVEVSINWDGLRRFFNWQGSTEELKQLRFEPADAAPGKRR